LSGDFDIFEELRAVEESVSVARERLLALDERIRSLRHEIADSILSRVEESRFLRFNAEFLDDFLSEPYVTIPRRVVGGRVVEWYVVVPRFMFAGLLMFLGSLSSGLMFVLFL